MENSIKKIILQMAAVTGTVVALGVWQYAFLAQGFKYNPYVNGAILLATVGSVYIAFRNVFKLYNEAVALNALQELWEDAKVLRAGKPDDPYWRHYRILTPAKVFRTPHILGHAYELVTEELARAGHVAINIETMGTLVAKVEQKINEEKSLLSYMSGLLVFMGLVGTFMGLLAMVGSIGGILAGLQSTGAGGSEAFASLLGKLQTPLSGMATGFAASLFGLFGSLVVGLLARSFQQAANVVSGTFENWLSSVAQINERGSVASTAPGEIVDTLARIVSDYGRSAKSLNHSTALLASLVETSASITKNLDATTSELKSLRAEQDYLRKELQSLAGLPAALSALEAATRDSADRQVAATNESVSTMQASLARFEMAHTQIGRALAAQNDELIALGSSAFERGLSHIEAMATSVQNFHSTLKQDITSTQRRQVEEISSSLLQAIGAQSHALDDAIARMSDFQAETRRADLAQLRAVDTVILQGIERIERDIEMQRTQEAAPRDSAMALAPVVDAIAGLTARLTRDIPARSLREHALEDRLEELLRKLDEVNSRSDDAHAMNSVIAAVETSLSNGLRDVAHSMETALSSSVEAARTRLETENHGEPATADDAPSLSSREFRSVLNTMMNKGR